MLNHWIKKLAVVALLGVGAIAPAVFASGGSITGAGSSWVYPLVAKWAAAYNQNTGIQVNYQPIGSGAGIAQIKSGIVDFGASDMPLKPEELATSHLIQFPTAIAGEDMVVNLPGVKPGELVLSGPVIADIYLGKIKKWNDPAIQSLNKGLALPDMDITVVHRADGSGTTFTFADYLSKVSPEWARKMGADTSLNWPVGVGGKGNAGVAAYVQRIRGAIGYLEYAYILENQMSYTRMYNRDGRLVSPSLKGFQAAAAHVDFAKARDFYVILTDQPGPDTWPIAGCTWQILRTDAPKATNQAVTRFFLWGFEHGQAMAESIAFGPLPASTVQAIRVYWKKNLGI
ncbi:MAG TPA: phosphate ABC transporter substrate-binding protein PstS [Gammaproteobacteria bacterium]|nr:phosphate ABC transporter substrate-binding protein PstS [Gammaproteobacteria bacterium]